MQIACQKNAVMCSGAGIQYSAVQQVVQSDRRGIVPAAQYMSEKSDTVSSFHCIFYYNRV